MSSVGKWESVGGDIKFLRLKQREIGGLVTDGSVRDTDEIINYGRYFRIGVEVWINAILLPGKSSQIISRLII
jgi:hypothetical protein